MKPRTVNTFGARSALLCMSALLVVGCASTRAMEQADTELDTSEIRSNIPGGHYDEFKTDFESDPGQKIELAMLRQNVDQKWMAVQVVCVGPKLPGDEICLRFAPIDRGDKSPIVLSQYVLNEAKASSSDSVPVPGQFAFGSRIVVDITAKDGTLTFMVNGSIKVTHPLDFVPEVTRIACSSALCTFKIK